MSATLPGTASQKSEHTPSDNKFRFFIRIWVQKKHENIIVGIKYSMLNLHVIYGVISFYVWVGYG